MGQMGNGSQLERAFAGATVHDLFNLLTVAVLFPLELISGYLYHLTKAMLPESVGDGDSWDGPIKKIVSPLADRVIKANKNIIKDISTGKVENCDAYYPVFCIGGIEDYKSCASKCEDDQEKLVDCGRVGLITCDKTVGCPAFFQNGATKQDDTVAGGVCFVMSLFFLLICLMGLVNVLQRGLMGMSTRVIYKATNVPGVFAIAIGAAITILVQSSSITTSVLTPLVGIGVIQLEQMFPLTLGANIGTTVTGLLASLVSDSVQALQVALCHLFFNITGIIIWYPIPFMRRIPLNGARELGKWTRRSRLVPPIYIIMVFFIAPLLLLGISELFVQKKVGWSVLGAIIVIALFLGILRFAWWWRRQEGREKFIDCLEKRGVRSAAVASLPEDMQYLKGKVAQLAEHTGLPEDEVADEEKAGASEGTDQADAEAEAVVAEAESSENA
jgi:sodium-dependent phosphate cotransporter